MSTTTTKQATVALTEAQGQTATTGKAANMSGISPEGAVVPAAAYDGAMSLGAASNLGPCQEHSGGLHAKASGDSKGDGLGNGNGDLIRLENGDQRDSHRAGVADLAVDADRGTDSDLRALDGAERGKSELISTQPENLWDHPAVTGLGSESATITSGTKIIAAT